MRFKLIYKQMPGNNTLFEGTFDEVWAYLVKTEGGKPLHFVAMLYEIKPC